MMSTSATTNGTGRSFMLPLNEHPAKRSYSGRLDLLRGALAFWVLLTHATGWSRYVSAEHVPAFLVSVDDALIRAFQSNGELHPAVIGFIVLSGYCVHRNGLRHRKAGALREYGIRRFFRIEPIFLLGTFAGLIALVVANDVARALSGTTKLSGACIAAKITTFSAFVPSFHQCAFIGNAPLATVMVEIVLYGIYAAVMTVSAGQRGTSRITCILVAFFVISLALLGMKGAGPFASWWQNGSLYGFVVYWWLGAYLLDPRFADRLQRYVGAILIAWVVLTLLLVNDFLPLPIVFAECRKLLLAALFANLVLRLDRPDRINTAWTQIGKAGYSVYAMHAPIGYTLASRGAPWWLTIAVCLMSGLAIYRFVEAPIARLGRMSSALVRQ